MLWKFTSQQPVMSFSISDRKEYTTADRKHLTEAFAAMQVNFYCPIKTNSGLLGPVSEARELYPQFYYKVQLQ